MKTIKELFPELKSRQRKKLGLKILGAGIIPSGKVQELASVNVYSESDFDQITLLLINMSNAKSSKK